MFEELKKRHILQIALFYLGAGWLCIEITDFIVGNYGFSRKILDTVVMLAILGFPAFLVIGWFHGERGSQRVQRSEVWLLLTLGVMGAVGTFRIVTGEPVSENPTVPAATAAPDGSDGADGPQLAASRQPREAPALAVLPFRNNISDPELVWLGPGVADLLTTNFAQLRGLTVVGRQSLYDLLLEEGRTEEEYIPESLATTVARAAGAEMMLWGTVSGSATDFVIDAQIIDLESGSVRAADRARGPDVFVLVDSLTESLARRIRPDRDRDPRAVRLAEFGTRDLGALRAYQRGIELERRGEFDEATVLFERASEQDSSFLLPLVRLQGRATAAPSPEAEPIADRVAGRPEEALDEAELDEAERRMLAATMEADRHRERAMHLLESLGDRVSFEWSGMSREEFLAGLDSTIARAVSGFQKFELQVQVDSTGSVQRVRRPPPPPDR